MVTSTCPVHWETYSSRTISSLFVPKKDEPTYMFRTSLEGDTERYELLQRRVSKILWSHGDHNI